VFDDKYSIILVLNFNTSGCLPLKKLNATPNFLRRNMGNHLLPSSELGTSYRKDTPPPNKSCVKHDSSLLLIHEWTRYGHDTKILSLYLFFSVTSSPRPILTPSAFPLILLLTFITSIYSILRRLTVESNLACSCTITMCLLPQRPRICSFPPLGV